MSWPMAVTTNGFIVIGTCQRTTAEWLTGILIHDAFGAKWTFKFAQVYNRLVYCYLLKKVQFAFERQLSWFNETHWIPQPANQNGLHKVVTSPKVNSIWTFTVFIGFTLGKLLFVCEKKWRAQFNSIQFSLYYWYIQIITV